MAKGGKYLDKNRSKSNTDVIREAKPMKKKKGRGWKIALIILLVLAILAGGAYIAVNKTLDHFISKINRAEYEERDVDDDVFSYWETYNPDAPTGQSEAPAETSETQSAEVTEGETTAETTQEETPPSSEG